MSLPLAYVGKVSSKARLHLIFDTGSGRALCGIGGWLHYPDAGRADLRERVCKSCQRREKELLAKEDHGSA